MSSATPDSITRNRSDSVDDQDHLEHDRKRPRLSEGRSDAEQILPSLESQDQPTPATTSRVATVNKHGETIVTSESVQSKDVDARFATSPTSKVTINTKPSSSQSMPATHLSPEGETLDKNSVSKTAANAIAPNADSSNATTPIPPKSHQNTAQDAFSIPSSPEKSPEIEIAEVEDYDQDPVETRWTSRIGGTRDSHRRPLQPAHVYRTFPFADERKPGDARNTVFQISKIFHEGDSDDGEIFQQVKNWLMDFTSGCESISTALIEEDVGFWQALPNLIEYLLRRETHAPKQANEHDLINFFVAYGGVARLMMEYDIRRLNLAVESDDPQLPKGLILMSSTYVVPLTWILTTSVPFYEALRTLHDFDATSIITAVTCRLAEPSEGNIFAVMTDFLLALTGMLSKKPNLFKMITNLIQFLTQLMSAVEASERRSDLIRLGSAKVLLKLDEILNDAITKQVSWLNIETGSDLINLINGLMRNIAIEIPSLGKDIITSTGINFDDTDLTDLPLIMLYAWKFKILRRFVLAGRMELRVYGIETMSTDLVAVYRHRIAERLDGHEDKLVRYLVKFIKETKLITFIIGVDSHPQLIQRSANILGFLCVAKSFTNSDIDVVWRTVLESQDPRTTVEVLHVLQCTFQTFDVSALHYLGLKLYELPFERFDTRMLQFSVALLEFIQNKLNSSLTIPNQNYDSVTRNLCMRLLREASKPENLLSDQAAQVRREISFQLPKQFRILPLNRSRLTGDEQQENLIIQEICQDIQGHTDFACGATQIMQSILSSLDQDSISDLLSKSDYLRLLLDDFAYLCAHVTTRNDTLASSVEIEYESRLSCLFLLLRAVPEKFDSKSIECLWTSLITARQVPDLVRSKTWITFADVMKESKQCNPAVDTLLADFFPRLRSHDFSKSVLLFAQEAVKYDSQQCRLPLIDADGVVSIPGIERVWKIMLEANPGSIETESTDFIIKQYLDGTVLRTRSRSCIEVTHSALIDRCVKLVMTSAVRLKSFAMGSHTEADYEMQMIATEDEIRAEELRFNRSLLFLRRFLEQHNSSRYSPNVLRQRRSLSMFKGRKGEDMEIRIQLPYSKYVITDPQKVLVGCENTGAELWQYLAEGSGYARFNVIALGHKLDLQDESATISELKLNNGLIIVQKIPETPEHIPAAIARSSSPVDNKIMHHFDELYELLDTDEHLAEQVYSFLSVSSVQNGMVRVVRSMNQSPQELLPPEKPYKLLYCTQSLRSCIEDESYGPNPDTVFLTYCVHTILAILPQLHISGSENSLQISIAYDLVDALNLAFRAKVPPEVSKDYISDHPEFIQQMIYIMELGLRGQNASRKSSESQNLARVPFESIIEASLHDDRIWLYLDSHHKFKSLLEKFLLQDLRSDTRHSLLAVILGLTGSSGTKLSLRINDPRAPRSRFSSASIETCLMHIWNILLTMIVRVPDHTGQCHEFLDALLATLRRIGKCFSVAVVHQLFQQCSELLLKHEHQENVGQPLQDFALGGLAKILLECCRLLKGAGGLPSGGPLIQETISKFLFPALSESGMNLTSGRVPVLDTHVRECLYDLVLALCTDATELDAVVSYMNDDLIPEDFFEAQYLHDRQCLRSEVGYAGLRNLSNTCYLNSLISQLFMNVQFRDFVLKTNIVDESKQRLMTELIKVFAYMQESFDKSVDPTSAIESISTYDGDQIDVTVQMDVDEFFNLLFDRLEGQIINTQERLLFKAMYGGQIVQQIKSKECDHISERLEPFSAIPVEIKGKLRLEDSLAAYVEGEVLQGENKYSCTACERHVDAVKRACLKDVPDNLIFNLKRFDFDIMTGMRCKINDEFHFPETIDVAPYTLKYLMNPDKPVESDMFELTGIIVHSGTADSGHYYSFIRQRPSAKDKKDSWVQFNDHDVTPFDPALIQDTCFGGIDNNNIFNLLKFYNGYMLFYQRASSIENISHTYTGYDTNHPIRLNLTTEMETHLNQQNELFLRSYCAQDPSHARFVRQLLEKMRHINENNCSQNHTFETRMLVMVLQYLQQVSSRWKELPDFEETMILLNEQSIQCYKCSETIISWTLTQKVIGETIIRSPYLAVRKAFGMLLSISLRSLHDAVTSLEQDQPESLQSVREYHAFFKLSIRCFANAWDIISRTGRAWSEYFGTLHFLLQLGDEEANMIIEENFIARCVEIVMIHQFNSVDFPIKKQLRARYATYLNAREKNRPFNHLVLFRFMIAMLLKVDFRKLPDGNSRGTVEDSLRLGLSMTERELLGLSQMPYRLEWLRRLIAGRQSPQEADVIVAHLAADRFLAGSVSAALTKGLEHKSMPIAVSFLRPSLVFCACCRTENLILDLVASSLEGILTIGLDYGKEYLDFVQGLIKTENKSMGGERKFLIETVLHHAHQWAPVFLISPNEIHHDVRGETVALLAGILFRPLEQAGLDNPIMYKSYRSHAQDLALGAQRYVSDTFFGAHARDNASLQPGQANQLIEVVDACLENFELDNPLQEARVAEIQNVMSMLKMKAEQAADNVSTAEWQESSEVEAMGDSDYEGLLSP